MGALRKNVRYLLRGRKHPQKQLHVTQNLMPNVETLNFALPYHEECLYHFCCIQLDFYLYDMVAKSLFKNCDAES